MSFFLTLAIAAPAMSGPMDFAALDRAIERCERGTVLPVFASEAQRRSEFLTAVYEEQAAISAERIAAADKRRALREAAQSAAEGTAAAPHPAETDQALALVQLELDDRQRALDERRRLETIRQQAVDLKRQYFLSRCASGKKPK